MSKELFRALDADVERLLVAGGGAASGDEGLAARRQSIATLGASVPFLVKVAEQAAKVVGAKARTAAGELLNLAAMNLQLRGAQASPGAPAGEVEPLPSTAPLDTPLPPYELEPLFYALTNSRPPGRDFGKFKRNKVIASAVERGAVHDLRLMELWVAALRDSGIGDMIVDKVIPKLGEGSAPYVLAAYDLKGGAADARRLRALTAARGAAARPLVDDALENGSLAVKAAALAMLGRIDPPTAETKALALIGDKNQVVRKACVEALTKATGDAALKALLLALDDTDDVRNAAVKVLGSFAHPRTTDALLELLTPAALDVKPYRAPAAAKAAKTAKRVTRKAPTSKADRDAIRAVEEKTKFVTSIFEALGPRALTPARLERSMPLVAKHAIEAIRVAAAESLLRSRDPRALAALAEHVAADVYELQAIGVNAFFRLDPATAPARATPFFTAQGLAEKGGLERAERILEELATKHYHLNDYAHYFDDRTARPDDEDDEDDEDESDETPAKKVDKSIDKGWVDVLLPALSNPKAAKFHELFDALGHTHDPRVIGPLSDAFKAAKEHASTIASALAEAGGASVAPVLLAGLDQKNLRDASIQALGQLREARAVEPLLALLKSAPANASPVINALGNIGDKRAAPALAAYLSKTKTDYPGPVLAALRSVDDPSVVPELKVQAEKLKKAKNRSWLADRYETLIAHLERDRTVAP